MKTVPMPIFLPHSGGGGISDSSMYAIAIVLLGLSFIWCLIMTIRYFIITPKHLRSFSEWKNFGDPKRDHGYFDKAGVSFICFCTTWGIGILLSLILFVKNLIEQ